MLLYDIRYHTKDWKPLCGLGSLESCVELYDLGPDERATAKCINGHEWPEYWNGWQWVTGTPATPAQVAAILAGTNPVED